MLVTSLFLFYFFFPVLSIGKNINSYPNSGWAFLFVWCFGVCFWLVGWFFGILQFPFLQSWLMKPCPKLSAVWLCNVLDSELAQVVAPYHTPLYR